MSTPAEELRTAATKLRDDRNCDGYTVDSNSRELLAMIRMLLNARTTLADWLEAESADPVTVVHNPMCPDPACTINAALAVARAINGQTRPERAAAGAIVDHLLRPQP